MWELRVEGRLLDESAANAAAATVSLYYSLQCYENMFRSI